MPPKKRKTAVKDATAAGIKDVTNNIAVEVGKLV